MDQAELIARADANYFDSMASLAVTAVSGEVAERDGVRAVVTGVPVPWLNVVFVVRPPHEPYSALRRAVELMDARGVPFVVRIREGLHPESERAAAELGLRPSDPVPGMIRGDARVDTPLPAGLEVRRVTEAGMDDFLHVNVVGFSIPEDIARQMMTPAVLGVIGAEAYTGYIDGLPVASSALIASHRVAGVYNVATLPDYRRRGLGAAMTLHAVRRGAEQGCVMASLQASEMGRPVYEGIGFRVAAWYQTWMRTAE
jgi:ribosomal protein S18 acetylase RimI-like enzyme